MKFKIKQFEIVLPGMDKNKKTIGIILLMAVILFAVFYWFKYGPEKKVERPLEKITVQLKWQHQAQFAGNYIAKEKGFYEREGLDVDFLPYETFERRIEDIVVNKEVDFALTSANRFVALKVEEELPLKAIAVIYKVNPDNLYTLRGSDITRPEDLIGKTIGFIDPNPDANLLYYAMLEKTSISNAQINEATASPSGIELIKGDVDVISGYSTNLPFDPVSERFLDKTEFNEILFADYGAKMYSDVLVVHEDTINNRPDVVEKFLRATLDGWRYVIEHNDEALDVTMKYSEKPVEHQRYMLEKSIRLVHTGDSPIGWMEKKEWENICRILLEQNILKDKKEDVETFYTMQFLNKIYTEYGEE